MWFSRPLNRDAAAAVLRCHLCHRVQSDGRLKIQESPARNTSSHPSWPQACSIWPGSAPKSVLIELGPMYCHLPSANKAMR